MSGYSRLYVIGEPGYDGLNPIYLQILVGDSDRQWLEPVYFDKTVGPMGKISTIIPEKPNSDDSIIDACLAFAPRLFLECPSIGLVSDMMRNFNRLDFNLDKNHIPSEWFELREEAKRGPLENIGIYEANLVRYDISRKLDDLESTILKTVRELGPLTYSEIRNNCKIQSPEEFEKFAFLLRKLWKKSFIEISERRYRITHEGMDFLYRGK